MRAHAWPWCQLQLQLVSVLAIVALLPRRSLARARTASTRYINSRVLAPPAHSTSISDHASAAATAVDSSSRDDNIMLQPQLQLQRVDAPPAHRPRDDQFVLTLTDGHRHALGVDGGAQLSWRIASRADSQGSPGSVLGLARLPCRVALFAAPLELRGDSAADVALWQSRELPVGSTMTHLPRHVVRELRSHTLYTW